MALDAAHRLYIYFQSDVIIDIKDLCIAKHIYKSWNLGVVNCVSICHSSFRIRLYILRKECIIVIQGAVAEVLGRQASIHSSLYPFTGSIDG